MHQLWQRTQHFSDKINYKFGGVCFYCRNKLGPKTSILCCCSCAVCILNKWFAVTSMNVAGHSNRLGWTAAEQGWCDSVPTGMIWTVLIGGIVADRQH